MTIQQEDVIRMIKDCGMPALIECKPGWLENLQRFAELVAAHEREEWRKALAQIFQSRMGAEQVREAAQAAIRVRCQT